MATTHSYVITSATSVGDLATIVGTVDGKAVTATCWLSHLQQLSASGGIQAVQAFIAGLLLAAQPPAPTPIPVVGVVGSFSL